MSKRVPKALVPRKRVDDTLWDWVLTEVTDASQISDDHILSTYGFASRNAVFKPICHNKYSGLSTNSSEPMGPDSRSSNSHHVAASGSNEMHVKVEYGDDADSKPLASCSKKSCLSNPNCLNYLGQQRYEDEGAAWEHYILSAELGDDPSYRARDSDVKDPVGLTNLGATCYCNAFLQVWSRHKEFVRAVMNHPSDPQSPKSPIYQLQLTFAAMENGKERIFNPVRLVESLNLNPSEQQDAQEFSKLFMELVRDEFKEARKATNTNSVIEEQFEGSLVYGIQCERCKKRSERSYPFLELEISLQSSCTLDSGIEALLQDEHLEGDNKYRCENCRSLQNATRYTRIKRLPPILHFGIMRFVYDFKTDSRKKKNHLISFPHTLDMSPYLSTGGKAVYTLQGILRHKGVSAYRGHYEAQVRDDQGGWLLCNDEIVARVDPTSRSIKYNKKRKEMDVDGMSSNPKSRSSDNGLFDSKDAYMLIYSRQADPETSGQPPCTSDHSNVGKLGAQSEARFVPPEHIAAEIQALNDKFEAEKTLFERKKAALRASFEEDRKNKLQLFATWSLQSHSQRSVVLSRPALESWVSQGAPQHARVECERTSDIQPTGYADATKSVIDDNFSDHAKPESFEVHGAGGEGKQNGDFDNSELACPHGNLDPVKSSIMKRVSLNGFAIMTSLLSGRRVVPEFYTENVCAVCVNSIFKERLYAIEHPEKVREFDYANLNTQDKRPGVWISRAWLKEWRRVIPSFHKVGGEQVDPSPDSSEWRYHVICKHSQLGSDNSLRVSITDGAYSVLSELFPSWNAISTDSDLCVECTRLQEETEAGKHIAAEEKGISRALSASTQASELIAGFSYAVVPSLFISNWKSWMSKPTSLARPTCIDCSSLICEHGMFLLDPQTQKDFEMYGATPIKLDIWLLIEKRYQTIENPVLIEVTDLNNDLIVVADKETCHQCRDSWMRNFTETQVTVEIISEDDLNFGAQLKESPNSSSSDHKIGTKRPLPISVGGRQSKRLRTAKNRRSNLTLTVKRSDLVIDVKQQITNHTGLVPIQQILCYADHELSDNQATLEQVGILAFATLTLRMPKVVEDGEAQGPDADGDSFKAFCGSLLGGTAGVPSKTQPALKVEEPCAGAETTIPSLVQDVIVLICPSCTFSNAPDANKCEMCETLL